MTTKHPSFGWEDIPLFVSMYDLELKILLFSATQKNAILSSKKCTLRFIFFNFFYWWLLPMTATPQLMLNRKWYQVSKPEMEFHMINIIYAALPMCAQTEKTTFSCKDDCTLTNHTRRWTYSALRYFLCNECIISLSFVSPVFDHFVLSFFLLLKMCVLTLIF